MTKSPHADTAKGQDAAEKEAVKAPEKVAEKNADDKAQADKAKGTAA